MNKRYRELQSMAASEGLRVDSITPTNGGNLRIIVEAPNGVKKTVFSSITPSDYRADANNRSLFRRIARENPAPEPERVTLPSTPLQTALAAAFVKTSPAPVTAPTPAPATAPIPTPVPAPDMTAPEDKPARTVRKLTFAETYKLAEFFKDADLSGCHTFIDAATLARSKTGIDVSHSTVEMVLETVGRELPKPPASAMPKDRTRVVARVLAELLRELGKEVPTDLQAISQGR